MHLFVYHAVFTGSCEKVALQIFSSSATENARSIVSKDLPNLNKNPKPEFSRNLRMLYACELKNMNTFCKFKIVTKNDVSKSTEYDSI